MQAVRMSNQQSTDKTKYSMLVRNRRTVFLRERVKSKTAIVPFWKAHDDPTHDHTAVPLPFNPERGVLQSTREPC